MKTTQNNASAARPVNRNQSLQAVVADVMKAHEGVMNIRTLMREVGTLMTSHDFGQIVTRWGYRVALVGSRTVVVG